MKDIIREGVIFSINPNSMKLYEFTAVDGTKGYMVQSGGMNIQLTKDEYDSLKG